MNLRELRAKRRKTQFDLRIATGIHQSKISHFEQGYIVPTPKERESIARALSVKPEDLEFSQREDNPCPG